MLQQPFEPCLFDDEETMSYCKVDDSFVESPRVTQASKHLPRYGRARVVAVWLEGVAFCQRHLTNGILHADDVKLFVSDPDVAVVAEALVRGELWERTDSGYRVKGFEGYYPSAAQREAMRREKNGQRTASRPPGQSSVDGLTRTTQSRDPARTRSRSRAGAASARETETVRTTTPPPNPPPQAGGDKKAASDGVEKPSEQAKRRMDLERSLGPEIFDAANAPQEPEPVAASPEPAAAPPAPEVAS